MGIDKKNNGQPVGTSSEQTRELEAIPSQTLTRYLLDRLISPRSDPA